MYYLLVYLKLDLLLMIATACHMTMCSFLQPVSSPTRLFSAPSSVKGFSMRLSTLNQKDPKGAEKVDRISSVDCSVKCYGRISRYTGDGSLFRRRNMMITMSKYIEETDADVDSSTKSLKSHIGLLKVFYEFTRPYLFIGSVFGVVSSSLIAIESLCDISFPFLIGLLKAIVSVLWMNVYSTGINQIFDVDIDKVNKPYLPLASGDMSLGTGIAIVSASALMAFGTVYIVGSKPLFWGILLYFIATSAYSVDLPLLRWKKSAASAAFSIVVGRTSVQLSAYLHMQTFILGRQPKFSRPLAFGMTAIGLLFIVGALFKDIPDIEGDQKFGIKSLAVTRGKKHVFRICLSLLGILYASSIVVGATSTLLWSKLLTIMGHVIIASFVWKEAKTINLNDKAKVTTFYLLIWKLVLAEFVLIPLVR